MTTTNTILFYDVETTGIPIWSKPSEDPAQPRVIQIAAELVDQGTRETLEAINFTILPNGWEISDEIAELTGITQAIALRDGAHIEHILPAFLKLWNRATIGRVGHNESFDARMIRIEMMKAGIYPEEQLDAWKTGSAYDTCAQSTKIVNLPPTEKMLAAKRKTPKQPNLLEAYRFFTGKELEGAHNAGVDVMACKEVYFALQDYNATQAA